MDCQKKIITKDKLNLLVGRSRVHQLLSFLAGYLIGELQIDPGHKCCFDIYQRIKSLQNLVSQKVINPSNCIEITVEVLQKTLRFKSNDNNVARQFNQIVNYLLQQVAIDNKFLIQKWKRQIKQDQQSKKSVQAVMKIIQQQQNKKKRQRFQRQKCQLQCQICLVQIEMSDLGTLQCGHMFHRQCLSKYVISSIESNKLDMKCPMEQCNKQLAASDVREFIDGKMEEKYDQFWFNKYVEMNSKDTSWCPTAGCSSVFSFDQGLDNYKCPSCMKHYCLKCKTIYHTGMTCAEYRINNDYSEEDKKFQAFVRGAKYKQCPKCNFWVERASGCSTMVCRCGHQFCYDCGGSDCPHGACKNLHPSKPMIPLIGRPGRKR